MKFHHGRTAARVFLKVLGLLAFTLLTFVLSFWYFEGRLERPVEENEIKYFLAVVVTAGYSELISLDDFDNYKSKNPDASFLIPNSRLAEINDRFVSEQSKRPGAGLPAVRVISEADGSQILELEIYIEDGIFESRYRATADSVTPLTLKRAGPGFIVFPMATTAAAFVLFCLLSLAASSFWRRRALL